MKAERQFEKKWKGALGDAQEQPGSDMWSQLATMQPRRVRPKDSFTAREFAQKFGIAEGTARAWIQKLVEQGRAECGGQSKQGKFYVLRTLETSSQKQGTATTGM